MYLTSKGLGDHLLAYAAQAAECDTIAELGALAAASVAQVGMTAIASGMITGPKAVGENPFHFNNWPAAWIARYRAEGYMECDPVPRWGIVSGAPIRWSDVMRELPQHDPGRAVYRAAREYNFREGAVVPVRTIGGHLGLVSVGGPGETISTTEFHFLVTISTTTLHRAEALDGADRLPSPSFSRRERECVALLIQGLTEKEISDKLGIREVTTRFHLDNARLKTGARSRTHLAAIAGWWLARSQQTSV